MGNAPLVLRLNWLLVATIGLPFFSLSCNAKPQPNPAAQAVLPAANSSPSQSNEKSNAEIATDVDEKVEFATEWIDKSQLAPSRIVFEDSFSNAGENDYRISNGEHSSTRTEGTPRKLIIFTSLDAVGDYSVSMTQSKRPIEREAIEGLLAISWDVVPEQLGYCTFVYAPGENGEAFNIAPIVNATTADDLKGILFRCRFKGENTKTKESPNFAFDLRLGFDGEQSFENRLDLGRLSVIDEWQNLQIDLGYCPNASSFLESASQHGDYPLRLEICQVGGSSGYQSGDTLLLDDIEFIVPQRMVASLNSKKIPQTEVEWIDTSKLQPTQIVYSDSFDDVKGSKLEVVNGALRLDSATERTRGTYIFADPNPVGEYQLQCTEESTVTGPDGKPGVLSFAWNTVPQKLDYCGFMYMGPPSGLTIDQVSSAVSKKDLAGVFVRFKCKASNQETERPDGFPVWFRMEPGTGNQYENRLDFGTIQLTNQWSRYQRELKVGQNTGNFLRALATVPDRQLRLIWSQAGGCDDYRSGDTLLIDDIEVIVTVAPSN